MSTESVEADATKKVAETAEKVTENVEKTAEAEAEEAAAVDEEEEQTNLIVNYLPQHVTEDKLREMFAKYGELEHVKLMLDKMTQTSMGYGFVKYVKADAAAAAIAALNGFQMDTKKLRVSYSHPRSEANVYVGNLKPSVTKEELEKLFNRFGSIVECKILVDHETGQSKGCGFVKFENVSNARDAINGLSGMAEDEYCLRPLTVKFARKHEKTHHNHFAGNGQMQRQPPRMRAGGAPVSSAAAPVRHAPVEYSGFCLFVYNLPRDYNDAALRSLFSSFGPISSANVMVDYNGACKGFGFVNFDKKEDAQKAVKEMNGRVVKNNPLSVSFKTDKRR